MTALVLVVLTAAVWVLTDAAGLRGFLHQRVGGRPPWQWFLATLVAAPVALPLYLRQRHQLLGRHRRWEMGTLELLDPSALDRLPQLPPEVAPAEPIAPSPPVLDLRSLEHFPPPQVSGHRRRLVAVGGTRGWLSGHLRRR